MQTEVIVSVSVIARSLSLHHDLALRKSVATSETQPVCSVSKETPTLSGEEAKANE